MDQLTEKIFREKISKIWKEKSGRGLLYGILEIVMGYVVMDMRVPRKDYEKEWDEGTKRRYRRWAIN